MVSRDKVSEEEKTECTTKSRLILGTGFFLYRRSYKAMKIIDITRTVQDAPLYHGGVQAVIAPLTSIRSGDDYNECLITAASHIGTHADAPTHYIDDDDRSIDKMGLDLYCGNCRVVSVPANTLIKVNDIRGKIEGVKKIVLHGGGKSYLCEEAAEYLIACGVHTIVTDALSVAPPDNERIVHEILMRAGAAIVENVILDEVPDGRYIIFAFPIKYGGLDGAPVRAVLVAQDN